MNEVIKQLYERKSVRVFKDKEISIEDKNIILESACQAPTAGNMQFYTILDITDQKLKEKLSETCDHQPFIAQAKMVLVFCADYQKWYDGFEYAGANPRKPRTGDLFLAMSDTNIAAQNAVVAAHSLGIGSCYIGDILENCEIHREILNLPKYVVPCAMLVFGYPTQQQLERQKPKRVDLKHIVHENTYRQLDKEELEEMWRSGMCPLPDVSNWLKRVCDFKYNSEFSVEMSRSCDQYLEEFK